MEKRRIENIDIEKGVRKEVFDMSEQAYLCDSGRRAGRGICYSRD
ncbi:MAG: hypothetical protein ACXU9W_06955 [Thermodesulfobacteriota bacterium]